MVDEKQKIETLLQDMQSLEGYIKDLFSFTPTPLCFVSPIGVILEVNPAFSKVVGCEENESIGDNLSIFVDENYLKGFLERAINGEVINGEETVIKNKKEEEVPVLIFAKARKTEDQEMVNGVFISFFDLTEIKKKEEEAEKSKKKLEEKVEEMEKFNQLVVGRELKMAELKEKIEKLEKKVEDIER
jgi:PAS domain S-box-containing protein